VHNHPTGAGSEDAAPLCTRGLSTVTGRTGKRLPPQELIDGTIPRCPLQLEKHAFHRAE